MAKWSAPACRASASSSWTATGMPATTRGGGRPASAAALVMRGRTCLLCTHNLAEAEALCDQVIILQEGRLIVQGRLEELRRGARPRVRLAARQGPEALRARLGQVGPIHVDGTGVLVEVADPLTAAPVLLRRLLDAGLDVYECTPVRATLEDLFLEAVR